VMSVSLSWGANRCDECETEVKPGVVVWLCEGVKGCVVV
jgi:hypothetical protein